MRKEWVKCSRVLIMMTDAPYRTCVKAAKIQMQAKGLFIDLGTMSGTLYPQPSSPSHCPAPIFILQCLLGAFIFLHLIARLTVFINYVIVFGFVSI